MSFRELEPLASSNGRDRRKGSSFSMCGLFEFFSKMARTRRFNKAVTQSNKAISVLAQKKLDIENQFTHANGKIEDLNQVIKKSVRDKNRIKAESSIRMRRYWIGTAKKYEKQIISLDLLIQQTIDSMQSMDVYESLQEFSEHTKGIDTNKFFDQFEKTVDNIDESKMNMEDITSHIQTLLSVDNFGEVDIAEAAHNEYEELLKEMEAEELKEVQVPKFTIDGNEEEDTNVKKQTKKKPERASRLAYTTNAT